MGRAPCCEKVGLKRGRWTAEEDKLLINYIRANGEGSWRALPKNAGLLRCGKSCRLRWINYLRSDLKRGNISIEEEELIVRLQASLGNRWSLIAGHLPGRTDNEIKNYWNSHLSKKLQSSQNTSDQNQSQTSALPSSASEGLTAKAAGNKRKHKADATSGAGSKTRQPKQKKKKLGSSSDDTIHPSPSEQPSEVPAVDNNILEDTFDDIIFTVPDTLAGDGFSTMGSVFGEESAGTRVMCSTSTTSTTDSRSQGTDYDPDQISSELFSVEDLLAVDSDDHRGFMNMVDSDFDEVNVCRDVVDADSTEWEIDGDQGNLTAVFGQEAQDMLSWLCNFDDCSTPGVDAGSGAGAGVGNLEYGNVEANEKHDAMVAWLLS